MIKITTMQNKIVLLFSILYFSCSEAAETEELKPVPDCDSKIYCQGDLLKAVQLSDIFHNSLDFVNMKMRNLPQHIEDDFNELDPSEMEFHSELRSLVADNFVEFSPRPLEIETYWKLMNAFEKYIHDEEYKAFYQEINLIWKKLAEMTDTNPAKKSKFHSMIYLQYCYMKASENTIDLPPSWRSYLIVRGLLSNQMFEIAYGIIMNYAQLIESHDFALYSNRVYFGQRSSLPFLALTAQEYVEANPKDRDFKSKLIQSIEKDYMWWSNNRRVKVVKNGHQYEMFRYHHVSTDPRPDKYKEDYKIAKSLSADEQLQFYSVVRDLDESTINFSSRFMKSGKNAASPLNSEVSNKIPVELNCLLLKTVEIISSWHSDLENKANTQFWGQIAKDIKTSIKEVLYDEERGAWFDWNLSTGKNDYTYYITNLMPLFTIIEEDGGKRAEGALRYMINEQIITNEFKPNYFIIPTSKVETGAEWDYPYGSVLWNMFIIKGLRNAKNKDAYELAENLGRVLIDTIYNEFNTNKRLLEHYRVNDGDRKYTSKESIGAGERGKNIVVESSSSQKSDKIFTSTLGATINLLKTFGTTAKPGDRNIIFNGIEPENPIKKRKEK